MNSKKIIKLKQKPKNILILTLFISLTIFVNFNRLELTTLSIAGNLQSEELTFSLNTNSNEECVRLLDEIQANYNTTNDQEFPSICALTDDIFVVTWASDLQDGDNFGVFARVFNATTGSNITSEFQVNTYTPDDQFTPSICALSSSKFVIAWGGEGYTDDFGVFANIFTLTGTVLTSTDEIRVNEHTASIQQRPTICALSSSKFVVAWYSQDQDAGPDGLFGVYARVLYSNGAYATSEIQVNYYTNDDQDEPSICALTSNTFAVAWQSDEQDGSSCGVYARIFDATTGHNITNEFRVNQYTELVQQHPSICSLSNGKFAVAWMSYKQGSNSQDIFARIFDSTGTGLTSEFRVNNYIGGDQCFPSITALSSDKLVITWYGAGMSDSFGICCRMFNATTGTGLINEFQVNQYTANPQEYPSICNITSSTFAVAWMSDGQDGDLFGVYVSVFGIQDKSITDTQPISTSNDNDDDDNDNNVRSISGYNALFLIGIFVVIACVIKRYSKNKVRKELV